VRHAVRSEDLAQIALFALFLLLPLADAALDLDAPAAPHHAPSAKSPEAPRTLAGLAAWPELFDGYYRDHFGWRSWLIRRFHQANYLLFRVSESDQVFVGRDGWLFYGSTATSYQRNDRPFTGRELRSWARSIRSREQWLESRGIRYLLLFAPNKHSIYPEHLPNRLRRVGGPSRYEALSAELSDALGAAWLDLHAPLRAAKAERQVYERTGSHWNASGAYVAYIEILERLQGWFPDLRRVPWEQVKMEDHGPPDLARMLALEGFVDERRPGPAAGVRYPRLDVRRNGGVVTQQDDPSLPRAVIFHDSFAVSLMPYLAEHFSYAVYQWRSRFDGDLILRVQPDVVIEERVERRLMLPAIPNRLPRARAAD
jgi:hypothetical protein